MRSPPSPLNTGFPCVHIWGVWLQERGNISTFKTMQWTRIFGRSPRNPKLGVTVLSLIERLMENLQSFILLINIFIYFFFFTSCVFFVNMFLSLYLYMLVRALTGSMEPGGFGQNIFGWTKGNFNSWQIGHNSQQIRPTHFRLDQLSSRWEKLS